ncbi:uncharacterized protein LOC129744891 [Uranotaenia lowii]|uniref:uncharacterized protein LOC129744891 n=1 Tax=Uranotaenia lowii TaxID=190385 RepID=UPI002479ED45|nr:uncharacterized protein LOC129744891 [Uranotaenia lowii]
MELQSKQSKKISADIRHAQCPSVVQISRRVQALKDNDPYFRIYARKLTQQEQVRYYGRSALMMVVSIVIYNVIHSLFFYDSYQLEPCWLIRIIGFILGVKDRIYF